MRKQIGLCAGLAVILSSGVVSAQDADMGPPKVLVIQREFVKPGKGAAHEKSESAFVNAFAAAKWPTYYFAAGSMSGAPRVLFFTGYPSFEAWEKDNRAIAKNASLTAALDKLAATDGDLLTEFQQSVYTYDADLSLHTGNIVHARYFEISQYHVKPGHRAEWLELVKLYQQGFADVPGVNWAFFESYYGVDNGGLYLAVSKMTSLSEDDTNMTADKKLADKLGKDGMKKLAELTAACIESEQTNLFAFNPKMSYVDESWGKEDSFWKPKMAAPVAKPAAAKPATP
jgi:hypothetical protein